VEITSRSADRSSDHLSKEYRSPTVALPTQHPHICNERECVGHPARSMAAHAVGYIRSSSFSHFAMRTASVLPARVMLSVATLPPPHNVMLFVPLIRPSLGKIIH
jgi:hypothetical protein